MLYFKHTGQQALVGVFDVTMVTIPVSLLFFSVFSPADQSRLRTFHIIEKSMTQSEAQAACRTKYTDLVTVYSAEDNTELTDLINLINDPGVTAWIGLNRNQSISDKWSNGDDVTFSNLTGVCGSGSCCAAMKADGSWENLQCTEKKNFMCYKQDLTLNYHLIFDSMSWYEAQSYCRKNYTDLVSITDQNQNEAVKIEGLKSSTSFWIGLLRDDWEWTDGGRSAYRNWETNQPWSSVDCVRLKDGKWESKPCSSVYSALCYSALIHVSDDHMSWESALDYCKKDNRNDILRIESDLDKKEVEFELRRRRVSGPLWVGLGQSRLSELLKSNKLALGPWTNWNKRQTESPPSLSCSSTDTVEKTLRQKMDMSALRAVCEVKQP
ncbi:secretory phospholipase A2 receptor-like [Colossoma macropomum]|uniref:secretory phospholipase A2 receptor-like n=1 Tax=Colossoma macropomum TaxID=42526 RepID=UPI0018645F7C|nr:secretory phospholipase A2 receptor-like [Colossoma macropomum]